MATIVTIKDKVNLGTTTNEIKVSFESESITVKDLIEARVRKEVDDYNTRLPEYFRGLVQPVNAEATLNGYRIKDRKPVDAEKQIYVALDAFQKNSYFVLVNNKQVDSLDQEVRISSTTNVSFMKLTPLIGG